MAGIDSYTKLCLHFDGTDGSTTITDSSLSYHTVTARGNAQLDTAQKKFGTASLLCDELRSTYIEIPQSDDFYFGTGDFTIDFWVRLNTAINGHRPSIFQCGIFDYHMRIHIPINEFFFYKNAADYVYWSASWSTATWYHIALVRNGSNYYFFKDGVSQTLKGGSPDSQAIPNFYSKFAVGAKLNGWIDEFRVSKGIARWTANFTPPTAAYSLINNPPSAPSSIIVEST